MAATTEKNFHDFCKRAEAEIQQQTRLFVNAIESLTHPFYVIDANDYTIKIANSATAIYGTISQNTTCYALTHKRSSPCTGEEHACPLEHIKRTKKPVSYEHVHLDKDGQARYYELHGYPIFDDRGEVVQMIEYTLDITKRKKAEEELKRAHDELERRVRERTADLEMANQALQKEINERIQVEKKLLEYQQRLRRLAIELTLSEEQQRQRIATDLHDQIGQSLALSKIKLAEIRKAIPHPQYRQELEEIYDLLEQTIKDIRTLTFELSPPVLYELGFEAAMEWLAETFQKQHGLEVRFHNKGGPRTLSDEIRTVLFRSVRELLVNVVKHARARHTDIELECPGDRILVSVSDDGVGFDFDKVGRQAEKSSGFGLFKIRERLGHFDGRMTIESPGGSGTKVNLSVPISTH